MLCSYYSFFFFFQAEDGIRDHCVTGVQTCALPISAWWDLPASYHGGSGSLSFADGHAEIKKWRDSTIANRPVSKVNPSNFQFFLANPNSDLLWLQERTSAPQ